VLYVCLFRRDTRYVAHGRHIARIWTVESIVRMLALCLRRSIHCEDFELRGVRMLTTGATLHV
jgi:hypothetical protein